MKCGSRYKTARSRKLFHLRVERWGTFKNKYFKPKQSSVLVSKVKNWTENHRKDQNLYPRNAEAVQRVFFLPTKQKPCGCCPWLMVLTWKSSISLTSWPNRQRLPFSSAGADGVRVNRAATFRSESAALTTCITDPTQVLQVLWFLTSNFATYIVNLFVSHFEFHHIPHSPVSVDHQRGGNWFDPQRDHGGICVLEAIQCEARKKQTAVTFV